jgi:hypothetical protein
MLARNGFRIMPRGVDLKMRLCQQGRHGRSVRDSAGFIVFIPIDENFDKIAPRFLMQRIFGTHLSVFGTVVSVVARFQRGSDIQSAYKAMTICYLR